MTGWARSTPTIANATQAAPTMISSPRYVPATVRAATSGSASATTIRIASGIAPVRRVALRRAGMCAIGETKGILRCDRRARAGGQLAAGCPRLPGVLRGGEPPAHAHPALVTVEPGGGPDPRATAA